MKIEVPVEELRKHKLMVMTPAYGGMVTGTYSKSMLALGIRCVQLGIDMRVNFIFNESLITRARNYCADTFLQSDCTHALFIDSDIEFEPDAALSLLALQTDDSPYDVICAPYPKKAISWEKIKAGVDKGFADENPQALENLVGDYVFNVAGDQTEFRIDQPVEVMESGTGFMMIRRKTFEDFKVAYPELEYRPDHVRSAQFDGSRMIHVFFDCIIDPDSKRYLSEDYFFCQYVRKMGGKVWLCPWLELKHWGAYNFGGSIAALAAIGSSPTADLNAIGKQGLEEKIHNNIQKTKRSKGINPEI